MKCSLKVNLPSLYQLLKRGVHTPPLLGEQFHTNLKWAWKDNEPQLLTPIASNKNGWKSNKNLEAMTGGN